MQENNWWATILIGAFIAIPFSILSNLMTPYFQRVLEKRSVTIKVKNLERLKIQLDEIRKLHNNPNLMFLTFLRKLLAGLWALFCVFAFISLMVGTTALSVYTLPYFHIVPPENNYSIAAFEIAFILILLSGYFIYHLSVMIQDINRLVYFDKYEVNAVRRIRELEAKVKQNQDQSLAN